MALRQYVTYKAAAGTKIIPDKDPLIIPEQRVTPPSGTGIEVEVEGVLFNGREYHPWTTEADGSLRAGGAEFKSPYLKSTQVLPTLQILNDYLQKNEAKHIFSKRTSVHVHLDCREVSLSELLKICLVNTTVEQPLFFYAGPERMNSRYCVPSMLSAGNGIIGELIGMGEEEFFNHPEMIDTLRDIFGNHYAALNIDNMFDHRREGGSVFGTIEFRHMRGTSDPVSIFTWVSMLHSLKLYAMETPWEKIREEINGLNTSSKYQEYLRDIFGVLAVDLMASRPINEIYKSVSNNVSVVKSWLATYTRQSTAKFLETPIAKRIQGVVFKEERSKPPPQKRGRLGGIVFDDLIVREAEVPQVAHPADDLEDHLHDPAEWRVRNDPDNDDDEQERR